MSECFAFERLDVYQRSVEFLTVAHAILDGLPAGQGVIADQLRRASLSIPLNIAEATGRLGRGEARRHHTIARGSAMECAALLDVCRILELSDPSLLTRARALLLRIVQMLTRLSDLRPHS